MTIPSKGSRRIRVGEVDYDWRIRKSPTYSQAFFEAPMRVAIQASEARPGRVLIVDLQVSRPDSWTGPHETPVTPAVVREIIERALEAGWEPMSTGSPVSFDFPLMKFLGSRLTAVSPGRERPNLREELSSFLESIRRLLHPASYDSVRELLDYNETVVAAEFLCDHLGEEQVILIPHEYRRLEALCATLGITDQFRGVPKPSGA
jgi:hypothetical protein